MEAWRRYTSLSDKTQPYDSARSLKSSGESWQLASFVMSGVAAVGLGVGIVGFVTGSGGTGKSSKLRGMVAPVPGGGVATMAGAWP
jgi:hypothetical protein